MAENFLISNTKRAALRHCSCISHILAASYSTPGHPPVFLAALLWHPSPMRHRHCPGTAGQAPQLGCCSLQGTFYKPLCQGAVAGLLRVAVGRGATSAAARSGCSTSPLAWCGHLDQ